MSAAVADSLGLEVLPGSALDAIIAATGLTGKELSTEMARMHIEAHAIRIRCEAEKTGTLGAIALWNETYPALDDILVDLIEGEPHGGRRAELTELYHAYIEAMHGELDALRADVSSEQYDLPPPAADEEMKDEERAALVAARASSA
jgi:hypothetical protein